MPCDQVQRTTLDVASMDPEVLYQALKSLGLGPIKAVLAGKTTAIRFGSGGVHSWQDGKLTVRGANTFAQEVQARISKSYTREAISTAARRQGFFVDVDKQNGSVLRLRASGGVA